MLSNIDKILKLSSSRIKELEKQNENWYEWNKTYISWLKDELQEVIKEIRPNNSVYLEDELWDIFWTYVCLLNSLKEEWYITSIDKVFDRCNKKFSERIKWVRQEKENKKWSKTWAWNKVKDKQKEELLKEYIKYNK